MPSPIVEAKRPNYENGFASVRTRAKAEGLARLATRESFARRLTLTQVDLIETDAESELADASHPAL
ncbi:hypothetical protein ACGYLO_12425 [Sulfitobacter sp. 1A13353]|uniref:hypothetical protein n=1 Tax=Sulfitobacter sp. 1A13353 TaxID=3368568 RepID=UPI003746EDD2